jgi:hypothetical protein
VVDFLLFHDFFKAGETHTFVEYLIGILSVGVIINALYALTRASRV